MTKTIFPSQACVFCGKSDTAVLYEFFDGCAAEDRRAYTISDAELEKPDRVVRCAGCGMVRAEPFPDSGLLRDDYKTMEDPLYLEEESGRREQAREVLRRIKPFKKRGRLLDVGCGPGLLVDEARLMGWDAQGIELSDWGRNYARGHLGLDVLPGPFEDTNLELNSFDVIVMLDVIEHLENPLSALKRAEALLKPGGILYLSTPDVDSALSRMLKGRWWGIQRHHLYYFSRTTLCAVLGRLNFKVIKRMHHPRIFSWRYWSKRLKSHSSGIARPFTWIAESPVLKGKKLRITLRDQVDVIARKPTTVDNVTAGEFKQSDRPLQMDKVIAVLPAYNAAQTLKRTVADIPRATVHEIILVDDASWDNTPQIARELGLTVVCHDKNRGYGGNQKTCYQQALGHGAEIVVMVHPDYQYDPRIIPQLIEPIRAGRADAVFGSRMMKGGALDGGMPLWKHNANILLTAFENVMLGTYLTEYHSGFRAYSARLLRAIPYEMNSDDFVFDTEIIVQILANGFKIEEVPIQTRYFEGASMIGFWRSVRYGLGILGVMMRFYLHDRTSFKSSQFKTRHLQSTSNQVK